MVSINYRDPRPIYEQIRDGFKKQILSGVMHPEDKMPSVRALASMLAINPNTIQRAYIELEAQGFIYSVSGKGSFVAEVKRDDAQIADCLTRLKTICRELETLGVGRDEIADIIRKDENL